MQQQLSKLQVGGANTTEARPLRTEHEELVEWEDYMQDWPDQLIIRRVNGRIRRTEFSQGFVASHAPRAAPSKSARKQAAASSSRHQAATGAGAGASAAMFTGRHGATPESDAEMRERMEDASAAVALLQLVHEVEASPMEALMG